MQIGTFSEKKKEGLYQQICNANPATKYNKSIACPVVVRFHLLADSVEPTDTLKLHLFTVFTFCDFGNCKFVNFHLYNLTTLHVQCSLCAKEVAAVDSCFALVSSSALHSQALNKTQGLSSSARYS